MSDSTVTNGFVASLSIVVVDFVSLFLEESDSPSETFEHLYVLAVSVREPIDVQEFEGHRSG